MGGELPNQYISGRVFVANANIQEITNVAYEEEIAGVEEDDEFIRYASFLSTDKEDEDLEEDDDLETDDTTESTQLPVTSAWWFIPSILFAVAVFAALIGVIIRKILHKRSTRKIKAGANSYDRRHTLLFDGDGTNEVKAADADDSLASFDDDKESEHTEVKLVASAEEINATEPTEEEFHDEFDD